MNKPIEVLVIDDHAIVRQGLSQLLLSTPGFSVVREAANTLETKAALKQSLPDVIILDMSLGKESGLDLLRSIRADGITVPVVVLSMYDEALYAERVLHAGGQAYLMKQTAFESIASTIKKVVAGAIVVSPEMQSLLLTRMIQGKAGAAPIDALTDREIEVLQLIRQGLSSAEIAESLNRSIKTIEAHRASLRQKLGLRTSQDLIRYALQWQPDQV